MRSDQIIKNSPTGAPASLWIRSSIEIQSPSVVSASQTDVARSIKSSSPILFQMENKETLSPILRSDKYWLIKLTWAPHSAGVPLPPDARVLRLQFCTQRMKYKALNKPKTNRDQKESSTETELLSPTIAVHWSRFSIKAIHFPVLTIDTHTHKKGHRENEAVHCSRDTCSNHSLSQPENYGMSDILPAARYIYLSSMPPTQKGTLNWNLTPRPPLSPFNQSESPPQSTKTEKGLGNEIE
jgi:hypothetical protein